MSVPRVLVVGGTGMLGRPVAERLVADGFAVRLLVRDVAVARGMFGDTVEYAAGDARDRAAVDRAMTGVSAVHVSLRGTSLDAIESVEVGGTSAVAAAAARADVARLTYVSGAGIEAGDPRLLPVRIKQAAERAIRASGVRATVLRPTHFMESLDWFVRGSKAEILGAQPHRYHYLAAADFAGQVSRLLARPEADADELTLLGPYAHTMREALDIYVRLLRPDVRVGQAPLPVVKAVAAVTRNAQLRLVTRLFDAFRKLPETGDGAAADAVVGRATTTLEQWCALRAGAA